MKNIVIFVGMGLLLFLSGAFIVTKRKIEEVAAVTLREAGCRFVMEAAEKGVAFPRDDGSTTAEQLVFLQEYWRNVSLAESGEYKESRGKYYDANIWSVAKNLPENPPGNLIVLATRNIDPSSLRTRLTEGDMEKSIRFDKRFIPPKNLYILKKFAAVVYADGDCRLVGAEPGNDLTCGHIYRIFDRKRDDSTFNLTTNLADGLQVKYLTTDGEAIPAND